MENIQNKVDNIVKKYDLTSSAEIRFIDLTSELGELGKEILKGSDYGKKDFINTQNLESEFGDVLFSLICVANELNIDLRQALTGVINKYEKRFSNNGNIGSGR